MRSEQRLQWVQWWQRARLTSGFANKVERKERGLGSLWYLAALSR